LICVSSVAKGVELGKFELTGMPPASDFDANGLLSLSAVHRRTGKENKIAVTV
jgi:molecular chaperone DnaK (HSP70)